MKSILRLYTYSLFGIFFSVLVYAGVTVSELNIIDFGEFLAGNGGGEVILRDTGPRFTGDITAIGDHSQGRIACQFTGTTTRATIVANPTSVTMVNQGNPTQTMNVIPIDNTGNKRTCRTSAPIKTLRSHLFVAGGQAPGLYVATYNADITANQDFTQGTFTGNLRAYVLAPIGITETKPINWGSFAAHPTSNGTITINESSGAVSSTSVDVLETASRGSYKVTGESGKTYNYTPSPQIITISSGKNKMTFDIGSGGASTLDGVGEDIFYLGGLLTVPAGQPEGLYTGNFTINIDY